MRSSDPTRASSSLWSNGFASRSSAPASIAASFSCSPLAVIITTGRNRDASSVRKRRQTSYPSIPGIRMSSSTRSTPPAAPPPPGQRDAQQQGAAAPRRDTFERLGARGGRDDVISARGEDGLQE